MRNTKHSRLHEDKRYSCEHCHHIITYGEMERTPRLEQCHECGKNRTYYPVWDCPNCDTQYLGTRPTASRGGVDGCNKCFISLPENHLREAIENNNVEKLEKFLPSDEYSMFKSE